MSTLNPSKETYEESILVKSGVPLRYRGHSFANFTVSDKTAKALEAASGWAALKEPKDRGFMLLGQPGVGKTHLAVAAIREIARLWGQERSEDINSDVYHDPNSMVERKMRFLNVPILLDGLRESIKFTDHPSQELYKYCLKSASVVVLDDFGKEKATDWATERLYVLVESRYQNMLSTVVTTNRTLDELDDLGYGAAVSRLQETCRVVRVDALDQRPKIGSQSK